jgi:hypothetical protein
MIIPLNHTWINNVIIEEVGVKPLGNHPALWLPGNMEVTDWTPEGKVLNANFYPHNHFDKKRPNHNSLRVVLPKWRPIEQRDRITTDLPDFREIFDHAIIHYELPPEGAAEYLLIALQAMGFTPNDIWLIITRHIEEQERPMAFDGRIAIDSPKKLARHLEMRPKLRRHGGTGQTDLTFLCVDFEGDFVFERYDGVVKRIIFEAYKEVEWMHNGFKIANDGNDCEVYFYEQH